MANENDKQFEIRIRVHATDANSATERAYERLRGGGEPDSVNEVGLREYPIISDDDANDTFHVTVNSPDEASHVALELLGWCVAEPTKQDDTCDEGLNKTEASNGR